MKFMKLSKYAFDSLKKNKGAEMLGRGAVSRSRKDLATGLLFLLPSIVVFGVFIYYSIGFNLYLSFTSWNFLSKTKTLIGLDNYVRLFTTRKFWAALGKTMYFAIGWVSFSLIFGLAFALLLNMKIPLRGLFRTIIFSPYVTTTAAVSLLWMWIFQPEFGLMNLFLGLFGIDGPHWLADMKWSMPAIIIMEVWRNTGYVMVIFLAGLQNIPTELYEAAQIDGVGTFRKFRSLTLPLLSPTTFFIVLTSLFSAFKVFDQVQVMTRGGPAGATTVLNYYIYEQAFVNFRAGYAASVSTVMFLILLVLTLFQMSAQKKWVHYV